MPAGGGTRTDGSARDAMVRGLRLGGRAAAAARWCTCRRVAVALCVGNLVAALLVARALFAPGSFAFALTKRTLFFLSSAHC